MTLEGTGLLPFYADASLEKLHPRTSRLLKDLVHKFDGMDKEYFYNKRPNVYLYGVARSGKTWVLHAIANKIIKDFNEKSIYFLTSPKLTEYFVTTTYDDYGENVLNVLAHKNVLMVDDLGQEYKSENRYIESRYEEFFRWRFSHNKVTFIASNADLETIEKIFGISFVDFLCGEYIAYEIEEAPDLSQVILEDKWKYTNVKK